jgi:hypothetical protein
MNLGVITQDATHRYRAIGTLTGFAAVFVTCGLAVMGGQSHVAVGAEWASVAGIAALVYVYGYVEAIRQGGSTAWLRRYRLVGGTGLYVVEVAGAIALILGSAAGLYVAAITMVVLLAFLISGAWLLIVGTAEGKLDDRG